MTRTILGKGRQREDLTLMHLYVHHETESAYLVSESGGGNDERVWLPKSQVEVGPLRFDKVTGADIRQFGIPDWLAEQEGLV